MMKLWRVCAGVVLGVAGVMGPAFGQDAATRFPAEGLAIFDCAPPAPAPSDSCVLRVPLQHQRSTLSSSAVDDANVAFAFAKPGEELFPEGLIKSATLLLIDLTPGPENGRRPGFSNERSILSAFAAGLPEGELVAVYGFHDTLELVVPFTTDRAAVREGIEGLSLKGSNTLIGTNVRAAIDILAEQDQALFRNLILVSDGEEEGGSASIDMVRASAVEADIALSAIGSYWRGVGAAEIGDGKAYLTELTRGGHGAVVHAELQRGADARAVVDAFGADLRAAASASDLIVATTKDGVANITVTLKEPVPGQPGAFRDQPITVQFVPEGFQAPSEPSDGDGDSSGDSSSGGSADGSDGETTGESAQDAQQMLFGYPALYTYIAAGLLALILALLLVLVLRRKADPSEAVLADGLDDLVDDGLVDDGLDFDAPVLPQSSNAAEKTVVPASPAAAPVAYLQIEGSGQRFAISRERLAIGRSGSNTIVINDSSISRVHAELHPNREGGFSVTDMQSLNGTFVNRERVKGTRSVNPGDTLTFGEVKTKLVLS